MGSTAPATPAAHVSVWSAIGHFFKHIGVVVSEVFVKLFGADAAHNFAVAAESLIKTDLGAIAMAAVGEASLLASGVDKRAAAFSKIAAAAKGKGLDIKDSIINLLIEMCVQRLKGSFGPATASGS